MFRQILRRQFRVPSGGRQVRIHALKVGEKWLIRQICRHRLNRHLQIDIADFYLQWKLTGNAAFHLERQIQLFNGAGSQRQRPMAIVLGQQGQRIRDQGFLFLVPVGHEYLTSDVDLIAQRFAAVDRNGDGLWLV
ncbi:hypothetical protein SDC9_174580 [bioreactor metagenome]|uniref:Uncharacterized protein n=1 Tax=bioreactor metagenome TaxID=1076179 RepID=A0A645GU29_9ZZZZ